MLRSQARLSVIKAQTILKKHTTDNIS